MPLKIDSLHKLLIHEIKDIYSAETQMLEALPAMAAAATAPELFAAFQDHEIATEKHVKRLEKIGQLLGISPSGQVCRGMEGLIEEGKKAIEEEMPPEVKDAALVSAAQRVEHYELAAYGTARSFAEWLGLLDVADLLQETLDEEGDTDRLLSRLADRKVNARAAEVAS